MLVVDMIFFWARAAPERAAIVQPDMIMTYRELADAIESIGDRIERLGLDKREPVAVSISVPAFMLATTFGLMRAGYTVAFANLPLLPHLLPAGIRTVIYDLQGHVVSGGRNIRFEQTWLPSASSHRPSRFYGRRAASNVNFIFFASDTVGPAEKIVQAGTALDQRLTYPLAAASWPYDKILIMPNLATSFGINPACEVLYAGKTACFAADVNAALSLIEDYSVEFVVASGAQALAMVQAKNEKPSRQVDSLKGIMIPGRHIGLDGVAAIRAALCGNAVSVYGTAKAGVIASAPFDLSAGIPDATGFVMPWVELEIVDESGAVLGAGKEGLVRYRTPELTESLKVTESQASGEIPDGWYYPGDIGRVTAEGILCLSGRS